MHGSFQGFVISCACRVVYSLLNSTFAEVMQMSFCVQPIVWVVQENILYIDAEYSESNANKKLENQCTVAPV